MEQGFAVDSTHGGLCVSHWAPGSPMKSFWTGTKLPSDRLPIGAFRCSGCGYLEFYADKVFAAR